MRGTLEFDLSNPETGVEEMETMALCLKARGMRGLLADITGEWIRNRLKNGNLGDEAERELEDLRSWIADEMIDLGLAEDI